MDIFNMDIFDSTILNILSNFIIHEAIICDGRSPMVKKKLKGIIQEKNKAFKNYRINSSNIDLKSRLKYL